MALQTFPHHIFEAILGDVVDNFNTTTANILSLRLVNQQFNRAILHAVYDRDLASLHTRLQGCVQRPVGISLERVVKGFMLRTKSNSDVLNNIRQALRDAALMLAVLMDHTTGGAQKVNEPCVRALSSTTTVAHQPTKVTDTPTTGEISGEESLAFNERDEIFADDAVSKVCRAYICLLREKHAFESLDPTWLRSSFGCQKLGDKTGHFWALLAAVLDGRDTVVFKAVKACTDRFSDAEDAEELKMHLAAGLLVASHSDDLSTMEYLTTQPALRINLRIQNIRFAGRNAMETAIELNRTNIITFLLERGWNFTTVPMDYLRALKAVAGNMKPSSLRLELFKILLEGDCHEWRSESVVEGILQELCKQGDLARCSTVVKLLRKGRTGTYNWKWEFEDKTNNDSIVITTPTLADNEEDEWVLSAPNGDNINALFQAVKNNHIHVIPFIIANRSYFPDLSANFTRYLRHSCEHAIRENQIDILKVLCPHLCSIHSQQLFIFSIFFKHLSATNLLLPFVDLTTVNKANSPFWDSNTDGSDLPHLMYMLEDFENPQNLLFNYNSPEPRNVKLGTYALLIAIKTLNPNATKLLLEKGCTIGHPLTIISPNLLKTRQTRLFFPHSLPDCKVCPSCTLINDDMRNPTSRITLITLKRFTTSSKKKMLEAGSFVPELRTRVYHRWNKSAWICRYWSGDYFRDTEACIITHIQIPLDLYWSLNRDRKVTDAALVEMRRLLKRYNLPDCFVVDLDS